MVGVPKSAMERMKVSSSDTRMPGRMRGSTTSRRMQAGEAPRSRAAWMLPASSLERMPCKNMALRGTKEIDCIQMTPHWL